MSKLTREQVEAIVDDIGLSTSFVRGQAGLPPLDEDEMDARYTKQELVWFADAYNGERTDNLIDNLELTTPEEHQRHHADETRERDSLS